MWKWDDSWLDEEYVWHDERRDLCGSHITKDTDNGWLDNPVVLYVTEDINLLDGEYRDDDRNNGHCRTKPTKSNPYGDSLDFKLKYKELKSLKGIRKRLKNKELVKDLEEQGGTCVTLPDSKHDMILLFWIGKTHGQVENIIDRERGRHENTEALEQLHGALKTLFENVGAEQTKKFVAEILQEVTTDHPPEMEERLWR
jgi:hypothetical protein